MNLHRLVCEFNLRPDGYVDRSWLPGDWPEPYREPGQFGDRARAVLAKQILATAGLAQQFDFDFAAPEKRVAIAPDAFAQPNIAAVHARGCAAGARSRADLRRRGRHSGETPYPFVMKLRPIFAPYAPRVLAQGISGVCREQVRERGYRVLLSFLSGSSTAVFGRFRLKLPKRVAELPLPALEVEQTQQVTELMLLCIIPERLGEWDWLF
jgi:type III secretion protein K